jgi:hypothetical protein
VPGIHAFWQAYRVQTLLFAGVFVLCGLTRIATSFDSRWSVPAVHRLVTAGDLHLDAYKPQMRESPGYGVVCVTESGVDPVIHPDACRGHWLPSYPIGGPILASPLIVFFLGVFRLLGIDWYRYHAQIELETASVLVAATAVLVFSIGRRTLTGKRAVVLALLFVFTTSAFSTASRALWQHTPSMLLLTLTISLLLRAEGRPRFAAWAALPVALAYTTRPSNALFVLLFTAYVAVRHRRALPLYLTLAGSVGLLFAAVNWDLYQSLLPPYYRARAGMDAPGYWQGIATAAAGLLVSPSRGLLLFTPLSLFSFLAMAAGRWRTPLARWLSVGTALYLALMIAFLGPASFPGNWWGGASYGPRLLTDLSPILALYWIPFLERWDELRAVTKRSFVVLAIVGGLIHYRAGWSEAVWLWNSVPASVDTHTERLWNWRDPQFLRGL